jgi:hypothetical protein
MDVRLTPGPDMSVIARGRAVPPVPSVAAVSEVDEGAPGLLRGLLATALFQHADPQRETAGFARTAQAEDLVPVVLRQVRGLLAAATARRPLAYEVTVGPGEPGQLLVTARAGGDRQAAAVQVVAHGELLLRDRVEALPAQRDRFHAAHGPGAPWCVLLAGDLTDHRVRQRVQSVHGRFAGDGDLVVAPQYTAGFLRLGPAELEQVAAVALAASR